MNMLTHTRAKLDIFRKQMNTCMDRMYDSDSCCTIDDFMLLLEKENEFLASLQRQVYNNVRRTAYDGLREDGVEDAEIFFARCISAHVIRPYFASLKQALPKLEKYEQSAEEAVTEPQQPKCAAKCSGKPAGIAAAGGVVAVGAGLLPSPVSVLLAMLGIAMMAGGVITIVKNNQKAVDDDACYVASVPPAPTQDEIIREILEQHSELNKKILECWCDEVLHLIQNAMAKEDAACES